MCCIYGATENKVATLAQGFTKVVAKLVHKLVFSVLFIVITQT